MLGPFVIDKGFLDLCIVEGAYDKDLFVDALEQCVFLLDSIGVSAGSGRVKAAETKARASHAESNPEEAIRPAN